MDITAVGRGLEVPIGGILRQTVERHVRFSQVFATHDAGVAAVAFIGLIVVVTGRGHFLPLATGQTALIGCLRFYRKCADRNAAQTPALISLIKFDY